MRSTITEATDFFQALSKRAEKQESRLLIDDVLKELKGLAGWLPALPVTIEPERRNTAPDTSSQNAGGEAQAVPPDPLVAARQNYAGITEAVERIRSRLLSGWVLDEMLAQTQSLLEVETERCRQAEIALKAIWLQHAVLFGKYLGFGLALSFLILVFADFIKSFFDTATNTRAILERISSKEEQTDTGQT